MRFRRIGVIYNPYARKGEGRKIFMNKIGPLIIKKSQEMEIDILIKETCKKGDGYIISRLFILEYNCDLILSVGGDGTNNEVVNGIMSLKEQKKCVLGIIPMGTGNDFSRIIWGEKDYNYILDSIFNNNIIRKIDLGSVTCTAIASDNNLNNNKGKDLDNETDNEINNLTYYFLNESSCGYSAQVIQTVNNSGFIINRDITFGIYSICQQLTYKNKLTTYTLDGIAYNQEILQMIVISNGPYFGSGMLINPKAKIIDGYLNICLVKDANFFDVLTVFPKIYSGTHINHSKVFNDVLQSFSASSNQKILVEADGEIVGQLPASWKCHTSVLSLIFPNI